MTFPGIDEQKKDQITEQMEALDSVINEAEELLKDADKAIDVAINRRGRISTKIQHLWIKRYLLSQEFERIRENQRRPISGGFVR
jgi:hypothetical protein